MSEFIETCPFCYSEHTQHLAMTPDGPTYLCSDCGEAFYAECLEPFSWWKFLFSAFWLILLVGGVAWVLCDVFWGR